MTAYTMLEVARMTGLHKNTIRNHVKAGHLKGHLADIGKGQQTWVIEEEDLYNCGIPTILGRLGPQDVEARVHKQKAEKAVDNAGFLEEITRLNRDLTSAREELGALRVQVPMLQAAQEERDSLREGNERLSTEVALLNQALEEARANARWSWRRRMKKAQADTPA